MKKLILLPLLLILTVVGFGQGQTRTVYGTVTDAKDGLPLPGVSILIKGTRTGVSSGADGKYTLTVPQKGAKLVFAFVGYITQEVAVSKSDSIHVSMKASDVSLSEVIVVGCCTQQKQAVVGAVSNIQIRGFSVMPISGDVRAYDLVQNNESYGSTGENRFRDAKKQPLSTFGIDVDAASYSNIRRFVNSGQLPPADAVRVEEMINYFNYDYPQPENSEPFSVNTEISTAPWNTKHKLVKIGLQGKKIDESKLPESNLVFLVDVSGSMSAPNKLPLVQSSLRMLTDKLRPNDKVAIVVYAGAAGIVLPSTKGDEKQKIKDALNRLSAGGSTAGGQGIALAYRTAQENFIKGGNNRVILATDGDFNVGASSDNDMQKLIEEKKESGIFLTVLGYGMGNYKDSKMEILADKGNGNYAYIDNISEANKVLVNEFGGTLFTIAKDVKLQLEFNPAKVKAYRLIGYENRLLRKEDFNNDKKDAGDMGSGHTVTALYEVIPVGVKSEFATEADDLKYQEEQPVKLTNKAAANSNELFTVKLRYKKPDEAGSRLIVKAVIDQNISWNKTSDDFRFSAAVAGYGMLLKKSDFKQEATFDKVIEWAQAAKGADTEGYRAEFLKMVKSSSLMAKDQLAASKE
ncbi:vWA domain-containing protein [Hufsiella ginkgonis]|uniref:DUF3520 domain-containing protein n=1 Tax=Hufsiella ginkgonis TaxID=2695274 RepID=A0A7K1XUP3_9SPHI|nr:VWA domain-containing protein [Hufsiella ginkgonis]MXV14702.1 DUF3520 domain-containing protein [Hufsiella ginkgonis]